MLEFKDVHGSQKTVDGLEFNVDTVYIRTNIRKESKLNEITKETEEFWVYDEKQYTYNEYVALLDKKVDTANATQDDLILDNAYRVAVLELNSTTI